MNSSNRSATSGFDSLALGQRADAGRVVDDEDRAFEGVFDLLLEDFALDHVGVLAGCVEADFFGERLHAGRVARIDARLLLKQLVVGFAVERRREVDHCFAPGALEIAVDGFDRVGDDRLGQVHHRAVIAEGLIRLEHRELGVVPRADPFVAIDAAQLVDPLHAADEQPLEMQLQGDPQEQLDVERVVMRDERPGRRAAGDGVQRGAFDLAEALLVQRVADRLHDLGAALEPLEHALAVRQIEIPHPLPQFGVGQARVLFRRRRDALGQEVQLLGKDRQLAGLRIGELAIDADDVAEVETARPEPSFRRRPGPCRRAAECCRSNPGC